MASVLSIGQCGYDDSRIGRLVRETIGATLERAHSAEDALRKVRDKSYSLVLVNRVFDGDGASGVDFVAELKREGVNVPVMLVSDYAEAQAAAVANGAVMGFGKAGLASADAAEKLRVAVGAGSEKGV
jgi:DNA-binding NtrC family response regulator